MSNDDMKKLEGLCFCGNVKFRVDDDFAYAGYCHCSQCRRSGSGGTAIAGIARDKLWIEDGANSLKRYSKGADSIFNFCESCGTNVFTDKPQSALAHVRFGILDEAPSIVPQAHLYVGSKPSWYEINDELTQFDEGPVI